MGQGGGGHYDTCQCLCHQLSAISRLADALHIAWLVSLPTQRPSLQNYRPPDYPVSTMSQTRL